MNIMTNKQCKMEHDWLVLQRNWIWWLDLSVSLMLGTHCAITCDNFEVPIAKREKIAWKGFNLCIKRAIAVSHRAMWTRGLNVCCYLNLFGYTLFIAEMLIIILSFRLLDYHPSINEVNKQYHLCRVGHKTDFPKGSNYFTRYFCKKYQTIKI